MESYGQDILFMKDFRIKIFLLILNFNINQTTFHQKKIGFSDS